MSNPLGLAEKIVRFVFQDSHLTVSTRKVHWRAVEPRLNSKTEAHEVSVFRTDSLDNAQINEIGFGHVAKLQGRVPKSKIEFTVDHVQRVDLKAVEESSTHERHANIVDWPTREDARLEKAKELAKALAADTSVKLEGLTPPET